MITPTDNTTQLRAGVRPMTKYLVGKPLSMTESPNVHLMPPVGKPLSMMETPNIHLMSPAGKATKEALGHCLMTKSIRRLNLTTFKMLLLSLLIGLASAVQQIRVNETLLNIILSYRFTKETAGDIKYKCTLYKQNDMETPLEKELEFKINPTMRDENRVPMYQSNVSIPVQSGQRVKVSGFNDLIQGNYVLDPDQECLECYGTGTLPDRILPIGPKRKKMPRTLWNGYLAEPDAPNVTGQFVVAKYRTCPTCSGEGKVHVKSNPPRFVLKSLKYGERDECYIVHGGDRWYLQVHHITETVYYKGSCTEYLFRSRISDKTSLPIDGWQTRLPHLRRPGASAFHLDHLADPSITIPRSQALEKQ